MQVTIEIDESVQASLMQLATEQHISYSQLMQNILSTAVKDVQISQPEQLLQFNIYLNYDLGVGSGPETTDLGDLSASSLEVLQQKAEEKAKSFFLKTYPAFQYEKVKKQVKWRPV